MGTSFAILPDSSSELLAHVLTVEIFQARSLGFFISGFCISETVVCCTRCHSMRNFYYLG